MLTLGEDPHNYTLSVIGREYRNPDIQCFTGDGDLGTSILGDTFFGNIQRGDDFDTVDDQTDDTSLKIQMFFQSTVNTQSHLTLAFATLNMDIGSPFLQGLEKERIDQFDNRCGLFTGKQVLRVSDEIKQITLCFYQLFGGGREVIKVRAGLDFKKFVLESFEALCIDQNNGVIKPQL